MKTCTRRDFLISTAATGLALAGCSTVRSSKPPFTISLAEWSFNRAIRANRMTTLDFPVVSRREYGIDAVEYVNQLFMDKAKDTAYLRELKSRCEGEGVESLLIMCDREGALGDPDPAKRRTAVENHYKWAEAARFLGCHSIRVNAQSSGTYEEQSERAADGLRQLSEFGAKLKLNVIVENHGGYSSNGKWLAATIRRVGLKNCGTLPDFGNFNISPTERYDMYLGVEELMPFAKGVSAKSHDFDAQGNETTIDYTRMMKIVLAAGYRGRVGIEYEGGRMSEPDGVRATLKLLQRLQTELA